MEEIVDQLGEENKSKRRTRKLIWITLGVLLLVIVGTACGVGLYIANAMKPVQASEQERIVQVPQGADSSAIAKKLEAKGLINNAVVFTYYLKVKKQGSRFQAGDYSMKPGLTFDAIIEKLNKGDTVKQEVLRITIPEGYTIQQIADKLEEQTTWKADVFLQQTEEPSQFHADVLAGLPNNKNIKHRLEGYLFPETYEFKKGSTEKDFIERSLQELDKKLGELPTDWKDKLQSRGLSLHQMLTIASLIEREVVLDNERALVSGVIDNRLKKNMPLQIDATVQYLFDKPKERLLEKDLQISSPYNTYLNAGLPPGPIASPSLASIKAAVYPEETKYLFYVTKKDGTKGHLFAETFEEHKKNITESKKTAK